MIRATLSLWVDAVAVEILDHLGSEFAGRLKDQRARHARPCPSILEQGEHRQGEGGGLTRTCLGDTKDVTARQNVRDGLSLDRCRVRVARGRDGLEDLVAQSEVGKRHMLM